MKHHHHPHHHHHHAHLDDPGRDAWQRPAEVVALLELAPGMIVADLGAGTGYFEAHLSRAVGETGRVLALEANVDLLAHLRQRFTAEKLSNVEARSEDLAPASVDRVLMVDVWHHLEDRVEYAKKLRGALKPGGQIYVVDRPHDSPEGPPTELRVSAAGVLVELTAAGFDASVVKTLPKQFVVRALPR